jgi:preprotein translocase subunit SecG
MTRIFGVLSTVFIIGFLAFGFRQALRQKAEAKKDRAPPAP